MNYTQNEKIEQVTDTTLVIGVDVGIGKFFLERLVGLGVRIRSRRHDDALFRLMSLPGIATAAAGRNRSDLECLFHEKSLPWLISGLTFFISGIM